MPLRVLMIDDEEQNVMPVKEELETNITGATCKIADFDTAASLIADYHPDIIVLDLLKKTSLGMEDKGTTVWQDIWKKRFCPLIFYTASDENPDDYGHPLVAVIRKGSGSEELVRDKVKAYLPYVAALGKVSFEINSALRRALRESRPYIFEVDSAEQENQLLTRTIRRRVAASMDDAMAAGGPNVKSWEQYLCPPSISAHLLTGDILRIAVGDKTTPTSYRVVLTPSCDLVRSDTREPKVESVLLARCAPVGRLLSDLGLPETAPTSQKKTDDLRKKLSKFLTQGYGHSSFPIAGLPGEFPVMAADFRCLEIVPLVELSDSTKYERIASVDAPFRELFVWAYLSAAGRPGMPDRDVDSWTDEIIAEVEKPATSSTEVQK